MNRVEVSGHSTSYINGLERGMSAPDNVRLIKRG